VTVVALLACVCVALAAVSTLALRASLVDRLDDALSAASTRAGRAPDAGWQAHDLPAPEVTPPSVVPPSGDDGRPPFLSVPGQSTGTLGLRLQDGEVREQGYLDDDGEVQELTAAQLAILMTVAADGEARTVDLPGLGAYRVVAVERGDDQARAADTGDGASIQVTGLSLDGTTATLTGYLTVEAIIGAAAVALAS